MVTLDSGINVGLTFINFGIFSWPYCKRGKVLICAIFMYWFKAPCLFFLPNFPGRTFIPCPMSIMESRVPLKPYLFSLEISLFFVGKVSKKLYCFDLILISRHKCIISHLEKIAPRIVIACVFHFDSKRQNLLFGRHLFLSTVF